MNNHKPMLYLIYDAKQSPIRLIAIEKQKVLMERKILDFGLLSWNRIKNAINIIPPKEARLNHSVIGPLINQYPMKEIMIRAIPSKKKVFPFIHKNWCSYSYVLSFVSTKFISKS